MSKHLRIVYSSESLLRPTRSTGAGCRNTLARGRCWRTTRPQRASDYFWLIYASRPVARFPTAVPEACRRRLQDRRHAPRPLAGRAGCVPELVVRHAPDLGNLAAGANKKRCRGQRHKCHEQGVFDEILALFFVPEIA